MTEFRIQGDDCPLADTSRATETTVDVAPPLMRDDGNVLLRFSSTVDEGLSDSLDNDDRIRYVNFRCLSLHPCVVHKLISAGFMIESLQYKSGNAIIRGAVVGHEVMQTVMETAGETVGVTLERVYALRAEGEASMAERWDLTPAQEESLRTAVAMGYFAVPRETTSAEVAEEMGISKSAFIERLHRAQHGLLTQLFPEAKSESRESATEETVESAEN
jgi:predicted DNA binding protein